MSTTSPLLRVQPGFIVIAGLFAVCGWQLHALFRLDGSPWLYTAVFTLALLVLIAVHELGHVVAACAYGHRITSIRIGSKFGVISTGGHTPRTIRFTAAAGPIVGAVVAMAVMGASPFASALWAAAVVALIENVANVALFFVPGSDGSKIVYGARCLREDADAVLTAAG